MWGCLFLWLIFELDETKFTVKKSLVDQKTNYLEAIAHRVSLLIAVVSSTNFKIWLRRRTINFSRMMIEIFQWTKWLSGWVPLISGSCVISCLDAFYLLTILSPRWFPEEDNIWGLIGNTEGYRDVSLTVTAPATVSGELLLIEPLGNREGTANALTRKSGDLPSR